MSVDKFKFISPGIFVNEIDNTGQSGLAGDDVGPVLIGRSEKGPILQPTRVESFEEFINVFGAPIPGGNGGDVARYGNYTSPTYAAYAAQAWLRNSSPVTYIRLGGQANSEALATNDGALAGWKTADLFAGPTYATSGGAYGLFVFQSSSAGTPVDAPVFTGSLAAVWYLNEEVGIGLSGTLFNALKGGEVSGQNSVRTAAVIKATGDKEFKVVVSGAGNFSKIKTEFINTSFNFDETSEKYIRKVFNTNPILVNSDATPEDQLEKYWLGESFDGVVNETLSTVGAGETQLGVILPLTERNNHSYADMRRDYQEASTGWFLAQDLTDFTGSFLAEDQQKLFKIHARNAGSWSSRNLKISIKDLKASNNTLNEYGSFTVAIRKMDDTDNRVEYVEQYNNCNLNPNSEDYIARKIGDRKYTWDDVDRRYKEFGTYPNLSKYIRVEMNQQVDKGDVDVRLLPFGVEGPEILNSFTDANVVPTTTFVSGGAVSPFEHVGKTYTSVFISGSTVGEVKYEFPKLRLRASSSEGNPVDPKAVYWGVDTTFNSSRLDRSVLDHLKPLPREADSNFTTPSFVFHLQNMCNTALDQSLSGTNVYLSGSRAREKNHDNGWVDTNKLAYITGSYERIIDDAGCDRFTTVLHGGFDGLDITETEPFRNSLLDSETDQVKNYALNSIQVAIDSARDPEVVEFNLAAMPGIKNNNLNRSLVNMCESRGDALAIIDLKHGYTSRYETTSAETAAGILGDVTSTVNNVTNELLLNSSYGAAYYPWVQIKDTNNGQLVWVPPSVAAIGAMSYAQRTSELWFAPAGFTRGGLSAGNAGLPVTAVREKLTSKQRDTLYDANINPIAQFPAEGIVIFGQKTLQLTPSALDRINVRRLLIFLKRQISRFAATVLFDQNVRSTWNRFRGRVEPFLASVQARLGITNFKLVLDETTTTQDLIEKNVMYAKIFIKPARAIEYIALDFILTDNGAAFED